MIAESAIHLLWDHPFRDLTVGRIMADTTLSRPAFYQYFEDLHHLIETLFREIEEAMHQKANPWIGGEGEPVGALEESLRGIIEVCQEYGPMIRAVSDASAVDSRLERAWTAFTEAWDDAVATRIAAQQAEGIVPPFDTRRTASALNRMNASMMIAEFGRRPQGDPDALLATLHRIWINTLYGAVQLKRGAKTIRKKKRASRSTSRRKSGKRKR